MKTWLDTTVYREYLDYYFDHDGANYSVIKLIPESIESAVYNEFGCYACELNYVDFLQKKNNLNPTKF